MFVSIPKESYWGQAVSPLAYAYIEKKYGGEIANRTGFCETQRRNTRLSIFGFMALAIRSFMWQDGGATASLRRRGSGKRRSCCGRSGEA